LITVIDYGLGNLRSVQKAFERIKVKVVIQNDPDAILNASRLILPGVGHFALGMQNLNSRNLIELLNYKVLEQKTPILGICLGMQLMTDYSEEGNCKGLGWIKAQTRKFCHTVDGDHLRIPHMGWNTLNTSGNAGLFMGIPEESLFYFVHSYHTCCEKQNDIIATTTYGHTFHSAFMSGNIVGCQFHPEKSHKAGLKLLKNFSEL
jgi:glutamine amidotransferase